MLLRCKQVGLGLIVFILISVSFQIDFCSCEDDFQTSVDHFMDAFDDAYSTEINSVTTEQGNEIPVEVSTVAEELVKENEVSFYQTQQISLTNILQCFWQKKKNQSYCVNIIA